MSIVLKTQLEGIIRIADNPSLRSDLSRINEMKIRAQSALAYLENSDIKPPTGERNDRRKN